MRFGLLPDWLNASPLQRAVALSMLGCVLAAGSTNLSAQVISADNLTPFQPRDVGTTSDAKTIRIKLNRASAISSIAIAPGNTEFTAGAVSGCVVDGHTVNPGLSVCIVDVTFSPQYPGLRTVPLVLTDGAGKKSSVGLTGIGLAPQAALTPGIITTIAGNGQGGHSGDGGPATEAELDALYASLDQEGNLYFTDYGAYVRKVDRNGIITTIAGNGSQTSSGDGGPATSAGFAPNGIALDAAGNLYIVDNLVRVRKVDVNGIITTTAGNGTLGYAGDGEPARAAELRYATQVAVDAAGNLYIADSGNNRIRKVDLNGIITTIAGNGVAGFSGDGGPATEASITQPFGVTVDTAGNLYMTAGSRIRKVDTNGIINTIAGTGNYGFSGDGGPATKATLDAPETVAVDAAGNVYIADSFNYNIRYQGDSRIRRIDTNGTIKTISGTGHQQYSGDGGPATQAGINLFNFAIDSSGALFVPDYGNHRVRKVDVSQSAVNFASQSVGTTSPNQQVTVTNTGNQHIELTGLSLTGDFQQVTGTAPLTHDCTDTTLLGAGFSCALRITFAPTAVGTLTGSATVTDNSLSMPGTKQTITLSGTGVNP
jgi:sugar lactone lactonase YvrE